MEVCFQHEAGVGQQNGITRRCAAQDRREASTHISSAACPQVAKGAALVLLFCSTAVKTLHLAEIGEMVSPAKHAALPDTIPLRPLPPKCPELNVMENLRQSMPDQRLSNRVFRGHDAIVGHCCHHWRPRRQAPFMPSDCCR